MPLPRPNSWSSLNFFVLPMPFLIVCLSSKLERPERKRSSLRRGLCHRLDAPIALPSRAGVRALLVGMPDGRSGLARLERLLRLLLPAAMAAATSL